MCHKRDYYRVQRTRLINRCTCNFTVKSSVCRFFETRCVYYCCVLIIFHSLKVSIIVKINRTQRVALFTAKHALRFVLRCKWIAENNGVMCASSSLFFVYVRARSFSFVDFYGGFLFIYFFFTPCLLLPERARARERYTISWQDGVVKVVVNPLRVLKTGFCCDRPARAANVHLRTRELDFSAPNPKTAIVSGRWYYNILSILLLLYSVFLLVCLFAEFWANVSEVNYIYAHSIITLVDLIRFSAFQTRRRTILSRRFAISKIIIIELCSIISRFIHGRVGFFVFELVVIAVFTVV